MAMLKNAPFSARYVILTDSRFHTASAEIYLYSGDLRGHLVIMHSGDAWVLDGEELPSLAGCTDIDLEMSPVTNTIPIRRVALKVGEKEDISAAWIRFPSLEIMPLKQSYERASDNSYIYRSSNFSSEIEVDSTGMVKCYGNVWKEITPQS